MKLEEVPVTPAMEAAGANVILEEAGGNAELEENAAIIACRVWDAMTEAHDKWGGRA